MLLTDIVLNCNSGLGLPMLVSAELHLASVPILCCTPYVIGNNLDFE